MGVFSDLQILRVGTRQPTHTKAPPRSRVPLYWIRVWKSNFSKILMAQSQCWTLKRQTTTLL